MPQDLSQHPNAVVRLRQRQLAESRRPFKARGATVKRCPDCLLAQDWCLCALRPTPAGQVAVCLVYYQGEVFKPSNSGRLIADVVADHYAVQWQRTEPDSALLRLLNDPAYAPILIFPFEYAEPERQLREPQQRDAYLAGRTPLLIFLDGTWREARKMFRSAYFAHLPVLAIEPDSESGYRLREAARDHQLGTAEVAIEILRLVGDGHSADVLAAYFSEFRRRYLKGKANHRNPQPPPSLPAN